MQGTLFLKRSPEAADTMSTCGGLGSERPASVQNESSKVDASTREDLNLYRGGLVRLRDLLISQL